MSSVASKESALSSKKESISDPATQEKTTPGPPKSKPKSAITITIAAILLLLTTSSALAYLIAYEKIPLKRYPAIQKSVINIVQSIPFMPKTPRFLLYKTANTHNTVSKQSFEISAAISSSGVQSLLGLNTTDIQATGAIDYSDPKNVFGHVNLAITKDFNFDLNKKDSIVYFRINKATSPLLPFLGISQETLEPYIDKWITYDLTPLQTEARKLLEQDSESQPSVNLIEEAIENYIDDKVLENMSVTLVEEDGMQVYKITLAADKQLLDYLGKKLEINTPNSSSYLYETTPQTPTNPSDIIKTMSWEIYIDKNYYTRKITSSFEFVYDQAGYSSSIPGLNIPLSQNTSPKLAIVAKFDNFGEDVSVDTPATSIPLQEFLTQLTEAVYPATESALLNLPEE